MGGGRYVQDLIYSVNGDIKKVRGIGDRRDIYVGIMSRVAISDWGEVSEPGSWSRILAKEVRGR